MKKFNNKYFFFVQLAVSPGRSQAIKDDRNSSVDEADEEIIPNDDSKKNEVFSPQKTKKEFNNLYVIDSMSKHIKILIQS